jgi:hypothetical protein
MKSRSRNTHFLFLRNLFPSFGSYASQINCVNTSLLADISQCVFHCVPRKCACVLKPTALSSRIWLASMWWFDYMMPAGVTLSCIISWQYVEFPWTATVLLYLYVWCVRLFLDDPFQYCPLTYVLVFLATHFSVGFPPILWMHSSSPPSFYMSANLILFDIIILIIFGEECKLCSWFCSFLQPPVTSCLFCPNIPFSTILKRTQSAFFP